MVSVTKLDRFFFPRFLWIPNEASSRSGYRLLSAFGSKCCYVYFLLLCVSVSLRVWVRGLLIRWVWVRGLLSASGWGGGLLSLRVWVRSFLTQPRAGSGYMASSASGSRLLNWIVFSFLGSCGFQMRPRAEVDTDYFPPSEVSAVMFIFCCFVLV